MITAVENIAQYKYKKNETVVYFNTHSIEPMKVTAVHNNGKQNQ